MKITLNDRELTGTPAEMLELLELLAGEKKPAAQEPDRGGADKPKPKPKQTKPAAKKATGKNIDWGKAMVLRKAGWSYKAIGENLNVSDVTVAAHLKPLE